MKKNILVLITFLPFLISCGNEIVPTDNEKIVYSENNESYFLQISELKAKYNQKGEKQVDYFSYKEMGSDTFIDYGISFHSVLCIAEKVSGEYIRINKDALISDLSIKFVQKSDGSNIDYKIVSEALKEVFNYSIADTLENTEVYVIYIANKNKLKKWESTDTTDNFSFKGNYFIVQSVELRNATLNNISTLFNSHFSENIVCDINGGKRYNIKFNLNKISLSEGGINELSFEDFNNYSIKKFGIGLRKEKRMMRYFDVNFN